jgi:hypothetical protein
MWSHHHLPGTFGRQELIIILTVIFILYGHRIPSVMGSIGRAVVRGPWDDEPMRFRYDPNTLWPTSLADWLVILMLAGLIVALLLTVVLPAIFMDLAL